MSAEFVKMVQEDDALVVYFKGIIDENFDFSQLETLEGKFLIFDMDAVIRLNSMGLRKWVLWVRNLKNRTIHYRNCRPTVIEQMNILDGFFPPRAIVKSFYVPYFCESCEHYELQLFDRGEDYMEANSETQMGHKIPAQKPCPACSKEMEWDLIESKFFQFLRYRARP